ncbi:hypothetical protein IWX49DRAFT_556302 [Phyllosticta citricarpa]
MSALVAKWFRSPNFIIPLICSTLVDIMYPPRLSQDYTQQPVASSLPSALFDVLSPPHHPPFDPSISFDLFDQTSRVCGKKAVIWPLCKVPPIDIHTQNQNQQTVKMANESFLSLADLPRPPQPSFVPARHHLQQQQPTDNPCAIDMGNSSTTNNNNTNNTTTTNTNDNMTGPSHLPSLWTTIALHKPQPPQPPRPSIYPSYPNHSRNRDSSPHSSLSGSTLTGSASASDYDLDCDSDSDSDSESYSDHWFNADDRPLLGRGAGRHRCRAAASKFKRFVRRRFGVSSASLMMSSSSSSSRRRVVGLVLVCAFVLFEVAVVVSLINSLDGREKRT